MTRHDLGLFGATGFTGQLALDYLARSAPTGLRLVLAGRTAAKLEAARARLPEGMAVSVIEADVTDPASLERLASSCRVLVSSVGPFIHHGEAVVAACVRQGTDYVDITGEPLFVDRVFARWDAEARRAGARVVNCCGFDSLPFDLGALYTVEQLPPDGPIAVDSFLRARGQASGGTYQSMLLIMADARQIPAARQARRALEPPLAGRKVGSGAARLHKDPRLGAWAVPLPTIDPEVVKRSARVDPRYGTDFRFAHFYAIRSLPKALGLLAGGAALLAGAQLPPLRRALARLRPAGEGPSAEQRARGWFEVHMFGRALDPAAPAGPPRAEVHTRVRGGDPGYGETSKMMTEAGLCLAFDREKLPARAGVLTPAAAMGDALIERLSRAGITFEVLG